MPEAQSNRPLGLALVGCGRISGAHLAAAAALPAAVRLVALVDPDLARARAAAEPFAAAAHDDLAAALADPLVEAVLIATPNALHADQALAALRAGKHVLVEKPAAESAAAALAMAHEAETRGLVLLAGHTFRHSEAVRQLAARRAGWGRLLALEVSWCVHWDGPQAPWWAERSAEDGLVLSLFAPHALDFVQLVMGADDPLRVHCEAARLQPGWRGEDEAMILLGYPGRRMASVHVSYNQPWVTDRKTLYFDRGVAEITDGEALTWNGERLVDAPPGALVSPQRMGGRTFAHCFRDQLADFAAAVRGAPPHSATGTEVARLIGLVDRVRASARANSAAAIDPAP